MVERTYGAYRVTIAEDREYTYGSADNVKSYQTEFLLDCTGRADIRSNCVIRVADEFEEVASCILLARSYAVSLGEHSVILHNDSCVIAVGSCLASVSLPKLQLEWSAIVDEFRCKEIHASANGKNIITRGSNRIACLTYRGELIWETKGGYQFSDGFQVRDDCLKVVDWDDVPRLFDISTGKEIPISQRDEM
ncbi:hypothetical protein [Symmachiella dynata]|uniref:hypothetical protein n=1 Tax=Symmachiella dynata TaxID=2527995 RepID=UPI0030ED1955